MLGPQQALRMLECGTSGMLESWNAGLLACWVPELVNPGYKGAGLRHPSRFNVFQHLDTGGGDVAVEVGGEKLPAQGQQAIEALLEEWLPRWTEARRLAEDPTQWNVRGQQLPPITLAELDNVLKRYKECTGLGSDQLHPRSLAQLPEEYRIRMIDLFHLWEAQPQALMDFLTKVIFLDKPDGGVRPICLTCAFLRIWSRLRQPVAKQWEAEHSAEFFWGSGTKSCERAGFVHNVFVAYCKHTGLSSVTCLADLEKFYEHVSHEVLYQEAVETGFNLVLLRALCTMYAGYRAISYRGMSSEAHRIGGTIMAGCSCALALAKLLLYTALKTISDRHPLVKLRNVVDDVTMQACGTECKVVEQAASAVTELLNAFRARRLPVSKRKTVYLASSRRLSAKLATRWVLHESARRRQARNLGTDATDGSKRFTKISASRLQKAKARGVKLIKLKKAGAKVARVHRAGPTAVALWGNTVNGVPPAQMHRLRLAALRSMGRVAKGTAVGLRMRCFSGGKDLDPLVCYTAQIAKAWALSVWEGQPTAALLDTCLEHSKRKLVGRAAPWSQVTDPVDAFLLSLTRIGWSVTSARFLLDAGGRTHDLLHISPALLAELVKDDARRWSDRAALSRPEAADGLWAEEIFWQAIDCKLHKTSENWCARTRASLRALVSNTHWTQLRLFKHKMSTCSTCQLCMGALGTLWHRLYDCPAWAVKRRQCTSEELRRHARVASELGIGAAEMFARALFPSPQSLWTVQAVEQQEKVFWYKKPADGFLRGLIFSDGSALNPAEASIRRAGWSLVQVSASGEVVSAAFGAVPMAVAPYQQARDGEDYAIHMLKYVGVPPFEIYTDCEGTLGCLKQPAQFSTGPQNPRAHLWGPFWAAFEPTDVVAVKTKAHCSALDVERGLTTEWERKANASADKYAKQGARINGVPKAEVWLYKGLKLIAGEAAGWAGRMHAHMAETKVRDSTGLPTAGGQEGIELQGEDADSGAVLVEGGAAADVAQEEAQAMPETRGQGLRINGHNILQAPITPNDAGTILFCAKCGAYSWRRIRQFRSTCQGPGAEGLQAQRSKIKAGKFPGRQAGWCIGEAHGPDADAQQRVCRSLGQAIARPAGHKAVLLSGPPRAQMSRQRLLQHYGIPPGGEAAFVSWAKRVFKDRLDEDEV